MYYARIRLYARGNPCAAVKGLGPWAQGLGPLARALRKPLDFLYV